MLTARRLVASRAPRVLGPVILVCAFLVNAGVPASTSAASHHPAPVVRTAKEHRPPGGHRRPARADHRGRVHRRGGRVQRAWPHGGHKPRTALARWLARQVGPGRVIPVSGGPRGQGVSD
jgi:hypothetical protein